MVSVSLLFDIPVFRTMDPRETANLLRYSARQLSEMVMQGAGQRRWKPKSMDARRVHVLASLPGVGRERAIRLLANFGTVEGCITASVDELVEVSGIGALLAERIRELVGSRALTPEDGG
jgi:Fanconi anemia group M protein